jgi:hypothetical protein
VRAHEFVGVCVGGGGSRTCARRSGPEATVSECNQEYHGGVDICTSSNALVRSFVHCIPTARLCCHWGAQTSGASGGPQL